MQKFIISTDSACDLPDEFISKFDIDIHHMFYRFNDNEIYGGTNALPAPVFYNRMRNGELPSTMAVNPGDSYSIFEKRVKAGYNIIHISFSSALSSTCQNAHLAASEIMDAYPESQIVVIDSLSASMGQGLLVLKACNYMAAGHDFDETVQYIKDVQLHIVHYFTVDDLHHLQRGGRLSKTSALLGSLIGIKPVLNVNDLGQLIAIEKVRGRKKSLSLMAERLLGKMEGFDNTYITVSHGDCYDEIKPFIDMIKEKSNGKVKEVYVNHISPFIGSHVGPGTVAFFCEGTNREP